MKQLIALSVMAGALFINAPLEAGMGAGDVGSAASALGQMLGGESETDSVPAAGLVGALTDQLGVSQRQAIGGSGALLGLAKNQLGGGQFGELTSQVPALAGLIGGDSGGGGLGASMLGGLSSLSGVGGTFSALGMSPDMIGRFAPVILDYLGNKGVGDALLGRLGNIWSPQSFSP